jgi:hypothetical protein
MRAQKFPIYLGGLFRELMTVLLYDKLVDFLQSGSGRDDPSTIGRRIEELGQHHRFAGSLGGSSTRVNISVRLNERGWSIRKEAGCTVTQQPDGLIIRIMERKFAPSMEGTARRMHRSRLAPLPAL